MPDLAAIILAAGGSSRMGRPKQLLQFDGSTLLSRAIGVASSIGCAPIVVVLGRDAEACRPAIDRSATAIVNGDWATGMGSSLRIGANAVPVGTKRAFILLCDQPRVTAETLDRLLSAAIASNAAAAVAAYADTLGPPVLVNADLIERLRAWPDAHGAKALWQTAEYLIESVPCPEAEFDVDTPSDFDRLKQ